MTDLTDFQRKMTNLLPEIALLKWEPLSKHTSFRIGGKAEIMAFPKSREELAKVLKASALLGVRPAILGAGTNVLAPDEGLPGVTICLKDCLGGMDQLDETHIRVFAGVTLTRAAVFAANLGLSGLEFAHGIPGTVGGGVYMNAGAYGGELSQVCCAVETMDMTGSCRVLAGQEMDFSYRHCILEETGEIVVRADFALMVADPNGIRERMRELIARRTASQPLDLPSAGSAFKRPQGNYAGALIEQAGLKGFRVGNAAISEKHAGFVVNLGGATAEEVRELLRQVSERVYLQSGIRLEPEVRIW